MSLDKNKGNALTDKGYDGVVFEPSYNTQKHKGIYRSNRTINAAMQKERERLRSIEREKKRQKEARFAAIYISILSVAVVICIVIFVMAFSTTHPDMQVAAAVEPTRSPIPDETGFAEILRITGQVYGINPVEKEIKLLDISSGKRHTFTVDNLTDMKDKYGKPVVFAEFKQGALVDIGFDEKSSRVGQLTLSPNAWEIKQVKDINVDIDNNIITFGNDKYIYDDNLLVFYNGKPYALENIKPIDIVSMTGYNTTVWSVYVEKSHGSLSFDNFDKIVNGNVEINTNVFFSLQGNVEPVVLLEGTHKLVVKGSNIETYTEEINVVPGIANKVDLSAVKLKTGLLNLVVNERDYELLINGELVELGTPIILEYGEHTVQLQKEDYEPIAYKVFINKSYTDLSVEFKKEIKLSKLTVETNPSGAEVYVDSAKIGDSPAEANLEYGDHTIFIRMEGYKEITIPITIDKPEQPYLVNLQKIDAVPPTQPVQAAPTAQPAQNQPPEQSVQTPLPVQTVPPETESSADDLVTPTPQRWYIQG